MNILRQALLFVAVGTAGLAAEPTWRAIVAPAGEPGERLVISGKVLREANGPPAAGTVITMYQTDANGIYSAEQGQPQRTARLKGRFVVGPDGQYEIVTIKPGPYPGGGAPAHIHVNLVEGESAREIFEFFFAGDPILTGKEKGHVLNLKRDRGGQLRATHDIVLKP